MFDFVKFLLKVSVLVVEASEFFPKVVIFVLYVLKSLVILVIDQLFLFNNLSWSIGKLRFKVFNSLHPPVLVLFEVHYHDGLFNLKARVGDGRLVTI